MHNKYLIDVNLPYHFSFWNHENFIHQRDIDPRRSDKDIWNYAKDNYLTIITKDTDFADRILNQQPPPRVIHFKTGNLTLQHFHKFLTDHWADILDLSRDYKLVIVYMDRLEGVG